MEKIEFFTRENKTDELMQQLALIEKQTTQAFADALASQEQIKNEYVQPCDPMARLLIAKARKAVIDHVDERLDAIEHKINLIMKATVPLF